MRLSSESKFFEFMRKKPGSIFSLTSVYELVAFATDGFCLHSPQRQQGNFLLKIDRKVAKKYAIVIPAQA
ncbi:MAG: hypothetical protein R3B84_14670 [Zavarzinella sp.]